MAKRLISSALKTGTVIFGEHALRELLKDGLATVDAENVLRGGVVDPPEFENAAWRYRIWTQRITVVVEFESETDVYVVTAWRNR